MPDRPRDDGGEDDPLVGRVLGDQYLVLEKIGAGGMGTVYLVEHLQLEKRFAAKVLRGDSARLPEAIARFRLEAVTASQLDHDNIIDVVNFGWSDDGTVFIVMELLYGETLNRALGRGRFGFEDTVRVAAQVCRALAAAHGADIVHRDLKPENVFIARRSGDRRVVKLLDFGISKIKDETSAGRLTRTGALMGSPLYMSPEAARGASDLDARADLYALGVMLYEMVTGQVPFPAANVMVALYRHLHDEPRPPRELRPDVPPALEAIILRLLAKDREDRHRRADELEAELLAAVPTDVDAPLGFAAGHGTERERDLTPGRSSRRKPISAAHTLPATPSASSERGRRAVATRPPTNLTAPSTRFIGRPREVGEVSDLVRTARLVTLIGAGGAGKTRLATEIARGLLPEVEHGVWFVELAAVGDRALLDDAVARALGLEARTAAAGPGALAAALAERRMLLVLDNCEHLIAACAALAESLVRACPGLHVLATSREPLGIGGETLYRVPPLSMPDPAQVATPADLDAFDAVQLFVERARAAAPGFELTAANAATVAQLCVRLDGMPLALELAAARVRNLSVEEVHARLGDRFRLLTGGSRTALPRHQTLRALIDWSHDLLDESQRIVLRRLAVFAGGFTLAQAEGVVATGELDRYDVLDLLCALVDRSLVVVDTSGASTRYRLLETIREYARERLDQAGEAELFRRRHRDELLAFAEAMAARYADSREDAAWFERLTDDHDNLRAAIHASLDADRAAAPAEPVSHRFVVALRKFWLVRGHAGLARAVIAPMLAGHPRQDTARMALLEAANTFATVQLDYAAATAHLGEMLALARALGDAVREATAMTHLAYLQFLQCRFDAADPLAREALACARAGTDDFSRFFALNIAGMVASRFGDHDRAIALLEECRAATHTTGGRQYHANVLESLATAFVLRDGDHRLALPLYREAAALFAAVGDRGGEVLICERMARAAVAAGDLRTAATILAAIDQTRERTGTPREPIDHHDLAPAIAAISAGLPAPELAAARAEGRALTFAATLALALAVA